MGPSPRVAVLHGQRRIVAFLELELTRRGYIVESAESAEEAFLLTTTREPRVIVLDPKIPGLGGVALLRLLRLYTPVPIVMLGAGFELSEQLACLENGADHCLNLPADIDEVVATLQAAMRRSTLRNPGVYVIGDLEVHLKNRTVLRAGRTIKLTRQEFDVLSVLAREPNRVFSRSELLTLVWKDELRGTERAVDACILGLRRKVDVPFGTPIIQTVRGVGFRLRLPRTAIRARSAET